MVPDFQKLIKDFGAESRKVREERGKEEVNISIKTNLMSIYTLVGESDF